MTVLTFLDNNIKTHEKHSAFLPKQKLLTSFIQNHSGSKYWKLELIQLPWDSKYLSASIAAIHPVPAAVIACRKTWSWQSPQAKTPSILVAVEWYLVTRYLPILVWN